MIDHLGMSRLWHYRQDRDMRTIMDLIPRDILKEIKDKYPREGTHHNALDDAKSQAIWIAAAMRWIKREEV